MKNTILKKQQTLKKLREKNKKTKKQLVYFVTNEYALHHWTQLMNANYTRLFQLLHGEIWEIWKIIVYADTFWYYV